MARTKRPLLQSPSRIHHPRKKARTSDQQDNTSDITPHHSPVSTDPDDSGTDVESLPTSVHNGTQHRTLDDDEAIERAASLVPNRRPVGAPADNGIIEEVSCTNFMCHSHLTIKLGPLINFIIGHNGSGKSAVLTALTLCLGGKASSTSRGHNLKAFIKEGRESATLSVKIKNRGPSAFKPEEFGESIIVERHFSRSGVSGFRVKNSSKKVLSKTRADVDDILDYFTLQLDNPMNVLTQDMARQFLNSAGPREKYKFFYKGTHLEALDHTYREIESGMELSAVKLQAIAEQVDSALSKYNDAQRASARAGSLRKLREEIATLDAQLAWVQVQAKENDADKIQDELEDIDHRIGELEAEERQASEGFANADKEHELAKAKVDEISKELEPLEAQRAELQTVFNDRKRELQDILTQQREIRSNHQGAKRDIKDTEKSIKDETAKLQSKAGGQLEDLQRKIAECEEEIKTQRLERHRLESSIKEAEKRLDDAKAATTRARAALDEKENIVQQSRRRIQDIDRERTTVTMDRNVEALVGAINRESGFREKPVGPIWRHVTLLDPKWSSVLERSFGTALDGFCVTSQADSKLLSKMMRRFNCNARIFIGNSQPISTAQHEPSPERLTWMRALRIDNDLVRNQLIINQGIEQTVLMEDNNEGMELMRQNVRNVRQVFCLHPRNPKAGIRLGRTGGTDLSSTPIRAWEGKGRMMSDREETLRYENELLQAERLACQSAQKELQSKQHEQEDCQKEVGKLERDHHTQKKRANALEGQLHAFQDSFSEANPKAGVIDALQTRLVEAKENLENFSRAFEDSVTAKDDIDAEQAETMKEITAITASINTVATKLRKAELAAKRRDDAKQEKLLERNNIAPKMRALENDKAAQLENLEVAKAAVASFATEAEKVSPRVSIPRSQTYSSLEKKRTRLEDDLAEAEREIGGSEEDLKTKELEAKIFHEEKMAAYSNAKTQSEFIRRSLEMRKERWQQFRNCISVRANNSFHNLLSERQFRGRINIDHATKMLDIQVQPDITSKSDKGRQTATLSGGEKSFSTICLLLSLWEAMGSPIRCLDEFDVFMDNVNRDVSMRMMIHAARRAEGRQFILITPQSMGNIQLGTDVKIHKMSDPERGQNSLPFQTQ